jgi:hypothetical protein
MPVETKPNLSLDDAKKFANEAIKNDATKVAFEKTAKDKWTVTTTKP